MAGMFMASLQSFDVCRYGVTIRGMLRGPSLLAEKYGNPTQKAKKGEDHGYDQWISMEPPARFLAACEMKYTKSPSLGL
ncbi:hypothetical protein D5086_012359 [Populus alba]|uniref:Uncharacterized protein n=1 Tax=Populus alba TaxID=43335 RepID=A0ACC4C359_POPAL